MIVSHITTVKETEYKQTKTRHPRKLEILAEKTAAKNKSADSEIDLSGNN